MCLTMWLTTRHLLITFAVLCVYINAAERLSFRKDWKFQRNVTFKYSRRLARDDNSFLFSVCSGEKLPLEMDCNVTISTPILPWTTNDTQKSSCKLNLKGSEVGGATYEISKIASIDRFEEKNVIIVVWERAADSQYQVERIIITILNMDTCTTNVVSYAVDLDRHILLSNIVIYPRSFTIALSNRKLCRSVACTIRHNMEGKRIGDPTLFAPNFAGVHLESVVSDPKDKSLYVSGADINAWKFKAMYVDEEGLGSNLMTVTATDPQSVNWTTSNSYGIYGICIMDNKRIYCAQFDKKGPKMNAIIRIEGAAQWLKIYNLKNNEMLLATGYCANKIKCRGFKVQKIGADGTAGKSVKEELNMRCDRVPQEFHVDISENGDHFCFYFACAHQNSDENREKVKFSSKCIPKSEVNQSISA